MQLQDNHASLACYIESRQPSTAISLISMAVHQKQRTASYTRAKKAPTAPECARVEGSEPSNVDRFGLLPPPPSRSPLETPPADVRPWGGRFRVWHCPHTDPRGFLLGLRADGARHTPGVSTPATRSITSESAPWHAHHDARTSV